MKIHSTLVLALTILIMLTNYASALNLSAGLNLFAVSWEKFTNNKFKSAFNLPSDFRVGISPSPYFTVGPFFSRIVRSSVVELGDLNTTKKYKYTIIGGYISSEFLPTMAITPYAILGGGAYVHKSDYETFFYKESETTGGLFLGLGGRLYLKRYASISMEFQYHIPDISDIGSHGIFRLGFGADVIFF